MEIYGSVTIHHDHKYILPLRLGRGLSSNTGEIWLDCPPVLEGQIEQLIAMVETAVGIIAATRLGLRKGSATVIVPAHPLLREAATELEEMADLFVRSRSLVAGLSATGTVAVGGSRCDALLEVVGGDPRRAVIAWSGGIDSTACVAAALASGLQLQPVHYAYYRETVARNLFANERLAVIRLTSRLGHLVQPPEWRNCDLSPILSLVPHLAYRDDIDIDGWELFGRNLLLCLLLWIEALTIGARHLILGLTAEDLYCTEEVGRHTFYSECCQSVAFVRSFNAMMTSVAGSDAPTCAVPLLHMRKGAVIRSLCATDRRLLFETHCCINDFRGEDGLCFSCYDKFWGIIATAQPEDLFITLDHGHMKVGDSCGAAVFGWGSYAHGDVLPIAEATRRQIGRFLAERDLPSSSLEHSKFHYAPALAGLLNLRERPKLVTTVFGEDMAPVLRLYAVYDRWRGRIDAAIAAYFAGRSPLLPGASLVTATAAAVHDVFCLPREVDRC